MDLLKSIYYSYVHSIPSYGIVACCANARRRTSVYSSLLCGARNSGKSSHASLHSPRVATRQQWPCVALCAVSSN
jgi:hypothetical protein